MSDKYLILFFTLSFNSTRKYYLILIVFILSDIICIESDIIVLSSLLLITVSFDWS